MENKKKWKKKTKNKKQNKQTKNKQYNEKTQTTIFLTTFNFRNWPHARLNRKKTSC